MENSRSNAAQIFPIEQPGPYGSNAYRKEKYAWQQTFNHENSLKNYKVKKGSSPHLAFIGCWVKFIHI
jgi:hypothetical protein